MAADRDAAKLHDGDRDESWPEGFVWSETYERPVFVGPPVGAKTIQRQWIAEIAEELADALHDHNIGRDIRGWRTVSEVFASVKAILEDRYA